MLSEKGGFELIRRRLRGGFKNFSERILHNPGFLLGQPFKTVQQLNHYRKELGRQLAASQAPGISLKAP